MLLSADVLLNAAGAGEAPRSILYVGIRDREHGWHRVLVPPVSTQVRAGGFPVKRPCNYPVLAAAWLHLDCHQHGDVYHTPQVLRPAVLFSLVEHDSRLVCVGASVWWQAGTATGTWSSPSSWPTVCAISPGISWFMSRLGTGLIPRSRYGGQELSHSLWPRSTGSIVCSLRRVVQSGHSIWFDVGMYIGLELLFCAMYFAGRCISGWYWRHQTLRARRKASSNHDLLSGFGLVAQDLENAPQQGVF